MKQSKTEMAIKTKPAEVLSPAEKASKEALDNIYACLEDGESFLLEAGAGAGKTYSLIKTLQYLIDRNRHKLPRQHQRIACITFTNVAKDEIEARTDRNPIIYCNTIHSFCWLLISGFQKNLRELIPALPKWPELIAEKGELGVKPIEYNLIAYRGIHADKITLHHDDVMLLAAQLLTFARFRKLMADKFPIILIDEYQDTNATLIEALKTYCFGQVGAPLFGLFGDHWQKIYGDGCGKVEHDALTPIGKKANFRSVPAIVDCLNRMRPDLPQLVDRPDEVGSVRVFHSNEWSGTRRTGNHWQGDLPLTDAHAYLKATLTALEADGWDLSSEQTKILMLTHKGLAGEQGYASLPEVFTYNDSFTKKDNPLVSFLVDQLDPACDTFADGKYGAMLAVLGSSTASLKGHDEKKLWFELMTSLLTLRDSGSVKEIIDLLSDSELRLIPSTVDKLLKEMADFDPAAGVEKPRKLVESQSLLGVAYSEIRSLRRYVNAG